MNIIRVFGVAAALAMSAFVTPVIAAANVAPVIKGQPATSVVAGSRYTFRPTATDANGDRIRFSISNLPSWATFNRTTGHLTGTPRQGTNATYRNIVIRATDGRLSSSLPAFSIRVTSAGTSVNTAPTISGTPATSVATAGAYSFTPTARDADGDALAFSIQNKPSWASFNVSTGRLSGTAPSTASTTSGIVISVSDGKVSAALPAFAIRVNAPAPPPSGMATLRWIPPTSNTDGSTLYDLAGFRLYYGNSPSSLTYAVQIPGAATSTYIVTDLPSGNWYFALSAYTTAGVESTTSAVVSKSIP